MKKILTIDLNQYTKKQQEKICGILDDIIIDFYPLSYDIFINEENERN